MRPNKFALLAVMLLSAGGLVLGSCGGGPEQTTQSPVESDPCALYNNFQMYSFAAKSGTPVPPAQYEGFFRGLVDAASRLARARPELKGSLDIVVNGNLALASGKPVPLPDPGQATFETAAATVASYQSQLCR